MKPGVIVWDLETVPDLFAAANDLVGKSDVEVREAIGEKFPKHTYHSIVCIGALIAHREPDHWAVDAIGAPYVGDRTEKQLIPNCGGIDSSATSSAPEQGAHIPLDRRTFLQWMSQLAAHVA